MIFKFGIVIQYQGEWSEHACLFSLAVHVVILPCKQEQVCKQGDTFSRYGNDNGFPK
jgi:hypothetical protein